MTKSHSNKNAGIIRLMRQTRRAFFQILSGFAMSVITFQRRVLAAGYYNLGAMWRHITTTGSSIGCQTGKTDTGVTGGWYGWGNDANGAVGGNSTVNRSAVTTAVDTSAAQTNWKFISTSAQNSYAINSSGQLFAVGNNGSGQIGNNSITAVSNPVQVGSSTTWSAISNGFRFAAGIDNGKLYSWGGNQSACLGNNSTTGATSNPTQVGAATDWSMVECGYDWALAIKAGVLYSWGNNVSAQLGINSTVLASNPTAVAGDGATAGWSVISAGFAHAAGIRSGLLYCWGENSTGSVGDNTVASKSVPTQIGSSTTWTSVSCGGGPTTPGHTLAVNSSGQLYAWGNNASGQLGKNTTTNLSNPTQVGTGTTWKMVAAATGFSLAVTTDGKIWTWGGNDTGQLGLGDTTARSNPTQITSAASWKAVSAGAIASSAGIA